MTSEEQEIEILKDAGLLDEAATHAVINFLRATWDSSLTKGELVIQEALNAVRTEMEVLEDTVEGHVKEVATLKASIELLVVLPSVIREGHKAEVERFNGVIAVLVEQLERHGGAYKKQLEAITGPNSL